MDDDLLGRLRALEALVAAAAQRFRAAGHALDDAFRGLYLTDEHIERLLLHPPDGPGSRGVPGSAVGKAADRSPVLAPPCPGSVLDRLASAFGLQPIDLAILVVALAPDLDRRFEQFYGYLHDDVTRRRATPGLMLDLIGLSGFDGAIRWRFADDAPLRHHHLVTVDPADADRPWLTRGLRVPDRVVNHLLGDPHPDGSLLAVTHEPGPAPPRGVDAVARLLQAPGTVVHLRDPTGWTATGLAAAAFEGTGRPSLVLDLSRAHPDDRPALVAAARRESLLTGIGLVVGPVEPLDPAVLRTLADGPVRLVLHGSGLWDPVRMPQPVLSLEIDGLTGDEQRELWQRRSGLAPAALDPAVGSFRLNAAEIERAVGLGRQQAAFDGRPLAPGDLALGARAQNSVGLRRLARLIQPAATWSDLVLPAPVNEQLHQIAARVAHRQQVLDGWGFRRGGGRGEGIVALFTGDSGTGKTLAAEVVAGSLGLDLYVVDLSSVVDKYIGETEKNLDRVFEEAEGVNGVLFFDEADALFGKRSEIGDAKDRYANVEVAYLLQRMERFDGLAVLASNLRGNLDEAFARRLSMVVDFPDPETEQRRLLWEVQLRNAPIADDVDLDFLAAGFPLTGGNIRNVAVTAAYLAASGGGVVTMELLIRGVQIEYRKLGRLCLDAEFGPYLPLLASRPTP